MYDLSIRVPLIIYDPRYQTANSISNMVLNIDIAATILDFADIQSPHEYQGESLRPYVTGSRQPDKRKSILVEHLWPIKDIPSSEGIRTEKWKYFRYRYIQAPEELYDLENDPLEIHNLAGEKKYEKIVKKLRLNCDNKIALYQSKKLCPDDPFIDNQKF